MAEKEFSKQNKIHIKNLIFSERQELKNSIKKISFLHVRHNLKEMRVFQVTTWWSKLEEITGIWHGIVYHFLFATRNIF